MDNAIHRGTTPFFADSAICYVKTVIYISNNRLFHCVEVVGAITIEQVLLINGKSTILYKAKNTFMK